MSSRLKERTETSALIPFNDFQYWTLLQNPTIELPSQTSEPTAKGRFRSFNKDYLKSDKGFEQDSETTLGLLEENNIAFPEPDLSFAMSMPTLTPEISIHQTQVIQPVHQINHIVQVTHVVNQITNVIPVPFNDHPPHRVTSLEIPQESIQCNQELQKTTDKPEKILDSTETLYTPCSFDQILGETTKPRSQNIFQQFIHPSQDPQEQVDMPKSGLMEKLSHLFRWFSLVWTLATTILAVWNAVEGLQNPVYRSLNANGLMIASIIFAIIGMLVSFVQTFPKTLWLCWDIDAWDPLKKSWSIWTLIADHELILDTFPILINVVLTVYSYRLAEVVADPKVSNTIFNSSISNLTDLMKPKYNNLASLILFGLSLVYMLLFHAIRVARLLIKKNAWTLSGLVITKSILLSFDMIVGALFLYEVLVYEQLNLFKNSPLIAMALSIVIPSWIVSLSNNAVVNFPLHYSFMKMKLNDKVDVRTGEKGASLSWNRVALAAARKTFHPLTMAVMGTYACWTIVGYSWVFRWIRTQPGSFDVSTLTLFIDNYNWKKDALLFLVGVNVFVNYAAGTFCSIVFWAWTLLRPFFQYK